MQFDARHKSTQKLVIIEGGLTTKYNYRLFSIFVNKIIIKKHK